MSYSRNKPKSSYGKPSFLKEIYTVKTDINGNPFIVDLETDGFVRYLTPNDYKKFKKWKKAIKKKTKNIS